MQITINVDEASGRISVEAEGQEPYECESPRECLEYLGDLLMGEDQGEPYQAEEGAELEGMDAAAMWDEEAAKRPPQRGLMA